MGPLIHRGCCSSLANRKEDEHFKVFPVHYGRTPIYSVMYAPIHSRTDGIVYILAKGTKTEIV